MEKVKIGILGGTRGTDALTKVLLNHPYAEVKAICESFQPLREKISAEMKNLNQSITVCADFDEMLSCDLDAVIIANYANMHAPYAIRALEHGLHVLSECVPCQTMAEAVAISEAVEKSDKLYVYAENYCYLPHVLEMRRLISSGDFGQLMHAEGNFINDCSSKWHLLTRGQRSHWRNHVPSTFYCTHSIGPLLFSTGRRAKTVVGMETPLMPFMAEKGARSGSATMEIMQLDNGAMAKSTNGNFRRSFGAEYRFVFEVGTMETDPYDFGKIHVIRPSGNGGYSTEEKKISHFEFGGMEIHASKDMEGMGAFPLSDVYLVNMFVQAILNNVEAKKHMIDIYGALDMSMVGTLAYRSILSGSQPMDIPNMREKAEREPWRNDHFSTDSSISAGEDLLPPSKTGFIDVDDEIYAGVESEFNGTPITSGMH